MHNWQLQKAPNPTSLEDKAVQEVPVPHEQMAVVSWPMQHPELDEYEQVVSLVRSHLVRRLRPYHIHTPPSE